MTARPFRIGILVDESCLLPAWEYEMLEKLIQSEFVFIIVFIQFRSPHTNENVSLPLFYRLFQKFEDWWFRSQFDASKKIDIKELIKTRQLIEVNMSNSSAGNLPDETMFEKIGQCDLDVIYITDAMKVTTDIGLPAKSGVWKINFGTDGYKDSEPPAFWEVMNKEAVTGSTLQVKPASAGENIIVYKGITQTVPYSVKNNFNSIAWRSSSYFLYRLKELYLLGPAAFFNKYKQDEVKKEKFIHNYKVPGNLKMLILYIKNCFGYLGYKISGRFNKKFTWLYSWSPFDINKFNPDNFKKMPLPRHTFLGDPFVIERGKRYYIFFEEYSEATEKGHIAVIEAGENEQFSEPKVVLDKPYHLSYPFVFEHADMYYMIPETCGNKTVELYRAVYFPYKWDFVKNLMTDVFLIDATLIYHNNKWWLFANTHNHVFTSTNDQLVIYYSEDIFSTNWVAHPQNPVVTDISNCRPAGKIFKYGNKLYRPAQNNASLQYGYGLNINEIEILNETEYRERKILEFNPGNYPNFSAIHTLNAAGNMTVIDGVV